MKFQPFCRQQSPSVPFVVSVICISAFAWTKFRTCCLYRNCCLVTHPDNAVHAWWMSPNPPSSSSSALSVDTVAGAGKQKIALCGTCCYYLLVHEHTEKQQPEATHYVHSMLLQQSKCQADEICGSVELQAIFLELSDTISSTIKCVAKTWFLCCFKDFVQPHNSTASCCWPPADIGINVNLDVWSVSHTVFS